LVLAHVPLFFLLLMLVQVSGPAGKRVAANSSLCCLRMCCQVRTKDFGAHPTGIILMCMHSRPLVLAPVRHVWIAWLAGALLLE
jgi:hypothetical protein